MQEGVSSLPPSCGFCEVNSGNSPGCKQLYSLSCLSRFLNTQPDNKGFGVCFTFLVVSERWQLSRMDKEAFWKKPKSPGVNTSSSVRIYPQGGQSRTFPLG